MLNCWYLKKVKKEREGGSGYLVVLVAENETVVLTEVERKRKRG